MLHTQTIHDNTSCSTKSKKTPGLNKVQQEPTTETKQLVHGEYFNLHTMQVHFETNTFIEQEIQKLKAWADLETSLRLTDFIDLQGYSPDVFRAWCAKYPILDLTRAYALRRIGSRREDGAINRKFAESTIHRTLGHYDSIWREETALLHQMKDSKNNEPTHFTVVMPSFESPSKSEISSKSPKDVAKKIHQSTVNNNRNHY